MLAGALISAVALRARDTIMLADAHGVRKRWMLGTTFIPWDSVSSIRLRYLYGAPWYYRVSGGQRSRHISWPIRPFDPSRRPQERGAVLITPDQMARLIAEHSAKPIQQG
jgi:hypothetical protein